MPLYFYYCTADHETQAFRSLSRRDEPCTCRACGKPAVRAQKTHESDEEPAQEPDRMVLHDFVCTADGCGHAFEEYLALSEIDALRCPRCGAAVRILVTAPHTDRFSQNLFPYFDRGLGCMVQSKAHRAQLCRERNLIPVDGDYDLERDCGLRDAKRKAAEEDAAYEEYMDELEHASHFAAFRQARDRGQFGNPSEDAIAGNFHPFRPE